jgi:spore coat protein U-like protein
MKKFLLLTAIASATSVAAVAPAMANEIPPAGGVVTVNATTTKFCTTPSNITVSLGEYNGTAAVGPNPGAVNFRCTNTTPATVVFSSASTASATGGKLLNGANNIVYTYTTAGTSVIGTGLATAANDLTSTANISIAAGQNPVPGSYSDTINVSVNY